MAHSPWHTASFHRSVAVTIITLDSVTFEIHKQPVESYGEGIGKPGKKSDGTYRQRSYARCLIGRGARREIHLEEDRKGTGFGYRVTEKRHIMSVDEKWSLAVM